MRMIENLYDPTIRHCHMAYGFGPSASCTSTPKLPLKIVQTPSNGAHKASLTEALRREAPWRVEAGSLEAGSAQEGVLFGGRGSLKGDSL